MAQQDSGIGTGTLVLSFITGLAAGIAAVLLVNASKEQRATSSDEQEDQLFI